MSMAGWGGFFTALGGQTERAEERVAKQDWEMAKYERLRADQLLDMKQKRTFDLGVAESERFQKGSEFLLENMGKRYASINSRLKGEYGLAAAAGEERAALEQERTQLNHRMQAVASAYLTSSGYPKEYINYLWPQLWNTDEDGNITGLNETGKGVEAAAIKETSDKLSSQASLTMATEEQDVGEPEALSYRSAVKALEGADASAVEAGYEKGEFYGGGGRQLRRRNAEAFWGNFKLSNIYKFVGGGGEKGDAEWEAVKKSLTEQVGAPEDKPGAILSDEAASDIITSNIIEGIKDGTSKLSSGVVDLIKKGVSTLKDFSKSQLEEIQEAVRAAIPVPLASAQELDDETLAQMDQDMASGMYREFASTDDEGMLSTGGGGLLKKAGDKYTDWWDTNVRPNVGGRLPQEFLDFQEKNPRLHQAIASGTKALYGKLTDKPSVGAAEGVTPGGRPYGETRAEDFIGSTEAIDALGRAGGPAADAQTEWTPEGIRAKLMEDVKNLIRRAESARNGYTAIAGSRDGNPDLTSMTIGSIHKKYGNKAVGIGQFTRRYLLDNAKKYLGYTSKELDALVFTPQIQDKFLEFGIQESGIDNYIAGKIDIDKFQANLAIRWRGLPPLGSSIKGESSDKHGNIVQIPGSEAQEILERWKEFQ